MMKTLASFILLSALVAAAPSCPNYPYQDFVWASAYSPPVRPPDSLLDDCQNLGLSNPQLCGVVSDSRFTTDQKKQLILDDFVKNNGFPPFAESDFWNSGIQFTKYPPDGVIPTSSSYIKDAWVKIVSLSPAVIDATKNKTYVNDTGKLRMAYAFTFVVPKETFAGDCRTDYAICGYNYSLEAFDNGQNLDNQNQPIANFEVPEKYHDARNDFSAVLSVNSEYLIHHYHLVTHCSGSGKNRVCVTTCDYSSTDDRRDSLRATDSKTAHYYGFIAFQNAFVDSFKNGLVDGWLFVVSNEDFNNIKFSVGNSFLKLQSRQYQLRYDLPPYNSLTPTFLVNPNRLQTKEVSVLSKESKTLSGQEFDGFLRVTEPGLYYLLTQWLGIDLKTLPITFYGDKIHFLAPAQELNCTVEINSHFGRQVIPDACRYNATQQPVLNLTVANATNASFQATARFYDNSTNAPLAGKGIRFAYGSLNATVETGSDAVAQTVFAYSPGVNVVSAEFLTDFETKSAKAYAITPTPQPEFLNDVWYWIGLAVILWLLYQWLKKWFA